jgi:diguanylate cyclase (GGDEF)-like protein/PAS domain S-box-containing protein
MLPQPDFPRPPALAEPVRILLLEDDRITTEIVMAYLRRIAPPASELHTAATLAGALAVLARAEVDLVLSDLHLPDSGGAGTIEALVRAVGCPVIAITSDADLGLRDATLACGAYDFLHKGDLTEPTLARLVRLAAVQARTFRSLRDSEGRLRAILNHEPQCVKLLDGEGRLVEMNPAGLRMIEADSLEPLRGHCVYGLVVAEHREAFRALTERVARGEEGTIEFEIVGLKGRRRWLEMRAVPLRDDVSAKQLVLGITRDVTEHRRGEAALRESEARFRALTELSSDWYWEQDAELRFVGTAGSSDERGGITPEAHVGLRRWELPSTEIVGQTWDEHRRVLEARQPFEDLLLRRVSSQGAVRYVSVAGRPMFDAAGAFSGYHGIAKDVTERIASELALRESEGRFRSLTGLSSDVYWEQDAEFRFTTISGTSPAWLESGRGQMLGQRRWERPYFNMTEADWAAHRADLAARRAFRDLELGRMNDEGERVWISVSGEPVFGPAGEFRGYRGVGKDITPRKREERLLRLEHETARKLAAAASAAEGVRAVMQAICAAEGWKCGRFFAPDPAAGVLRFDEAASWHEPGFEGLNALSRGLSFERGAGLTGEVWASGRALWVSDTARDPRVRQVLAQEPRLRSAFCFPVLAEGAVVGVVTMWNDRMREPDRRLQDTIELIGSLLGQFLRRKEAEVGLQQRQAAHLRYQERIARFGQTALAQRDRGELIEKAVQAVREALGAQVVVYESEAPAPGARVAVVDGASLPFAWSRELRRVALLPVRGENGACGALCAGYREASAFGAEEMNFAEAAASVLSTALLRIESEARVAYLAQFDALTGLPNRTLLADRFSQMIMHAKRHAAPLAALFIDLDGFKTVNDTLGHAGGDALLKQVALRLQSTVRGGDTVARISGDEFAIVLGDLARLDDAALVAQKVIDGLAATVNIGGKEVFVTASVGIAVFPGDGEDAETLIAAADAAMYRAKQSGRNAYQFFTAEINQRSRARAQMGADLRRALERDELMLAYQPKVDLATRRTVGAEALLRWNHPERGLVPPAEFIPVMEETGLIVPVGDWVLRRACADLKAWQAAGYAVQPMAINLSARQFRRADLDVQIQSLVAAAGIDARLIELEITESQLMIDPDHAIRVMRALCNAGMRIAIDDFGTGYSSLSYLNRFPVSALKIDRSFVKDMARQAGDATIVRTIVEMARSLGCTVVAEGVETEEQAAFLRLLRCEQAQGYLFARPMPAAEFVRLLRKR